MVMMAADGANLRVLTEMLQFGFQGVPALHGFQNLRAGEGGPIGGDNHGGGVLFPQHGRHFRQLLGIHARGAGEDDRSGEFHLVVKELAEILHVHLAFFRVHHGGEAVEGNFGGGEALHGANHIAELAHARGLDEDAVGGVLFQHLLQRLAKIAHQAAADAALAHFRHLDAGVLHKAAVNTDFAEFVFNQHKLFALEGLGDELLNQRGFARAQEAGENIDLRHGFHLFRFLAFFAALRRGPILAHFLLFV